MRSPGSRAVAPSPDPGLLSLYDEALPQVYGFSGRSRCSEALLVRARSAFRRLYVTTGGSDD